MLLPELGVARPLWPSYGRLSCINDCGTLHGLSSTTLSWLDACRFPRAVASSRFPSQAARVDRTLPREGALEEAAGVTKAHHGGCVERQPGTTVCVWHVSPPAGQHPPHAARPVDTYEDFSFCFRWQPRRGVVQTLLVAAALCLVAKRRSLEQPQSAPRAVCRFPVATDEVQWDCPPLPRSMQCHFRPVARH